MRFGILEVGESKSILRIMSKISPHLHLHVKFVKSCENCDDFH